jgi:hypothetical protein
MWTVPYPAQDPDPFHTRRGRAASSHLCSARHVKQICVTSSTTCVTGAKDDVHGPSPHSSWEEMLIVGRKDKGVAGDPDVKTWTLPLLCYRAAFSLPSAPPAPVDCDICLRQCGSCHTITPRYPLSLFLLGCTSRLRMSSFVQCDVWGGQGREEPRPSTPCLRSNR